MNRRGWLLSALMLLSLSTVIAGILLIFWPEGGGEGDNLGLKGQPCRVSVDAARSLGRFNHFWKAMGSGHAYLVLHPAQQVCYARAAKELGIQYIRFHGILDDDVGVYHEDSSGNPRYDWTRLDQIYDFMLSVGIRPMVDLCFMPGDLAATKALSGDCYGYGTWSGLPADAYISPPRDYGRWEQLIYELVKHCTERYGAEEVARWYFEVWNEPDIDLYWSGTRVEYHKLYQHAAAGGRRASPTIRIGGPAISGVCDIPGAIENFLRHCCPKDAAGLTGVEAAVDFVSFHTYGEPALIIDTYARVLRTLKQFPQLDLPALLTEYNISCWSQPERRESEEAGVFIAGLVHQFLDRWGATLPEAALWYWTVSDIFEEHGWPAVFAGQSFGVMNRDSIPKPAFNVLKMLHMMGNERVALTSGLEVQGFATRRGEALQLLLYNSSADLEREIALQVSRIPFAPCPLRVTSYVVDHQRSNAYTAWLGQGSPRDPTPAQLEELRARAELELSEPVSREWCGGSFHKRLRILPRGVVLLLLEREAEPGQRGRQREAR